MQLGKVQQFGTPFDVYAHPANRMVADFMGLVNLVPGKVREVSNGAGSVEIAGAIVIAVGALDGVGAGESVDVSIRPRAESQVRAEARGAHRVQGLVTLPDRAEHLVHRALRHSWVVDGDMVISDRRRTIETVAYKKDPRAAYLSLLDTCADVRNPDDVIAQVFDRSHTVRQKQFAHPVVIVHVHVDEPRKHKLAGRIYDLRCLRVLDLTPAANLDNLIAFDQHDRIPKWRTAVTVYDRAANQSSHLLGLGFRLSAACASKQENDR